jgi:hypothetical protein
VKGYTVVFGPLVPGVLGGREILGFLGPGESGPRRVDRKRKAKDRRRRKLARAQKRRMRKRGG